MADSQPTEINLSEDQSKEHPSDSQPVEINLSEDQLKEIQEHPYLAYIGSLNMTQCYKELLLAGNKEIEKYVPNPAYYQELRVDFVGKYPEIAKEFEKLNPVIVLFFKAGGFPRNPFF